MTFSSTVGICQVYEGASILITGGSGTVGKILLEKILRSCPGVERIYVLIRNRQNQLAAERLEQMLETELFSKLSEVCPNFRTKCVAVTGNTRLPKLGISEEDEERLVKDVNFVFNLAANIRLDNVKLRTLDSEYLEMIKGGLIGRTSSEYLFTKTLSETLLETEGRSLPVCMVRIPLVAATLQDPFPGWIDGIGGIVGFVLAVGTGVMRNGILDPAYVTEALPADMVVSCLIAAGWATAVSPYVAYWCRHRRVRAGQYLRVLRSEMEYRPALKRMWV